MPTHEWLYELEMRQRWLAELPDGIPCDHPGCLSHVSHPCEVCGRVAGRRLTKRALDLQESAPSQSESTPEVNPLAGEDTIPPANQ